MNDTNYKKGLDTIVLDSKSILELRLAAKQALAKFNKDAIKIWNELMSNTVYERACTILQANSFKLTFTKLEKLVREEGFESFDKGDIQMAIDWGKSLYKINLPSKSNAYIALDTHVIPLYIDKEKVVWRINKQGNIKEVPLDRSYAKFKIQYLYDMSDDSFDYFNIGQYTLKSNNTTNTLPIRQKVVGDFDLEVKGKTENFNKYIVEFWYDSQWYDLLKNIELYKQIK